MKYYKAPKIKVVKILTNEDIADTTTINIASVTYGGAAAAKSADFDEDDETESNGSKWE